MKSSLALLLSSVYGKVLYYLIYLLLSCYWLLLLSKYNHSELSYISGITDVSELLLKDVYRVPRH